MIMLFALLLNQSHAAWKLETRASRLLIELPKPPRKRDQTITARDLDDHFAYPCVDDDEIETRPRPFTDDTVLPRALWTDEHRNEFWICAAAKDFEKIDDRHVFTDQTFVLASRDRRKRFRLMLGDGPILDRPLEVFLEKGGLRVLSLFPTADDRAVPFTVTRFTCGAKGCEAVGETCALDTKVVEAESAIKKFDAAVAQARKHPEGEPPTDLDQLFFAAAAGNKAAATRIEHYPIELPEDHAAADQINRYQTELIEAERVGCGKKR